MLTKSEASTSTPRRGDRDKLKRYKMLLIPFIVNMWRMADDVAIAMESRAFGAYDSITLI